MTVKVVPAAMVIVPPRISTVPSVCDPVIVPAAKVTVLPEAAIPPAVQVQLCVVRNVPVMVRVPPGLLTFTIGRSLVAISPPVQACAAPPLMSSVAVPPVKPLAAVTSPWVASVPVLRFPLNRFSGPVTVRVVPTAMITVPPRISTVPSVWDPVIVPAAKVTVLPDGAIAPAVHVQLRVVRNVPVMVSVPLDLLMFTTGRSLVVMFAPPFHSCAPPPLMSRVPVPPVKPTAALMSACAASVPVTTVPLVRVTVPAAVRVVPAAIVTAPPAIVTAPRV